MVEKAKAGNEVRRTPFERHPEVSPRCPEVFPRCPEVFLKLFVKKCAHDIEVLERHVPALGQPHASCKHGAAVYAVVGDPHAR
jgi:hypothetical protein